MNTDIMTYDEAHYLDIGSTLVPDIELLGVGVTQLDENSNPTESSKQYINDTSKTNKVTGYDDEFPINSDLISNDDVVVDLYEIFTERKTGSDAQRYHYIVELWNLVSGTTYRARRQLNTVVITGKVANPGEQITFSGSLKGAGDFVAGTFNTTTKVFTADSDVSL
ncbi:MAG: hypothetical protein WC343_09235 [Bacilli bacterium]|jgi:hypothetical protein